MEKLRLLPRKEFEIILEDGAIIKGKYSLWSIKRFCDKLGLTLVQLGERLTVEKTTFDDTIQIVLCAVEDRVRKDKKPFVFTDQDACEWIEWLGGMNSEDYLKLQLHAASEEEKKSIVVDLSAGRNLNESATQVG